MFDADKIKKKYRLSAVYDPVSGERMDEPVTGDTQPSEITSAPLAYAKRTGTSEAEEGWHKNEAGVWVHTAPWQWQVEDGQLIPPETQYKELPLSQLLGVDSGRAITPEMQLEAAKEEWMEEAGRSQVEQNIATLEAQMSLFLPQTGAPAGVTARQWYEQELERIGGMPGPAFMPEEEGMPARLEEDPFPEKMGYTQAEGYMKTMALQSLLYPKVVGEQGQPVTLSVDRFDKEGEAIGKAEGIFALVAMEEAIEASGVAIQEMEAQFEEGIKSTQNTLEEWQGKIDELDVEVQNAIDDGKFDDAYQALSRYEADAQQYMSGLTEEGQEKQQTWIDTYRANLEEFQEKAEIPDDWWGRVGWGIETGGGLGKVGRTLMTGTYFDKWGVPTLEKFENVWWGEKSWAAGLYGLYTMLPGYQPGEAEYRAERERIEEHDFRDIWRTGIYGHMLLSRSGYNLSTLEEQTERSREIYEEAGAPWEWALEFTHPLWVVGGELATLPLKVVAGAGRGARAGAEATRMLRYSEWAARNPARAAQIARMAPALEALSVPLTVAGAPARSILWTGKLGETVVSKVTAGGLRLATRPFVYGAGKGYKAIERWALGPEFEVLTKLADDTGFKLAKLPAPAARLLRHPYRVAGNGVDLLARDLVEVRRLLETGELLAMEERFYVPALKKVFRHEELAGLRPAVGIPAKGVSLARYEAFGESIFRSVNIPEGMTSSVATEGARAFNVVRAMESRVPSKLFIEGLTIEALIRLGFQGDGARRAARAFAEVPLLRPFINMANRSALVTTEIGQAMIAWGRMREYGSLATATALSPLKHLGNPIKTFGITEIRLADGRIAKALCDPRKVKANTAVEGWERLGVKIGDTTYHAIGDVIEHPKLYILSEQQEIMVHAYWKYMDELKVIAEKNGVNLREMGFAEGDHYFPRFCLGKDGITIEAKSPIKEYFGAKQSFDLSRVFDEQALGIKLGYTYEGNPITILDGVSRAIHNRVADEQCAKLLSKHGLTESQIMEILRPGYKAYREQLGVHIKDLNDVERILTRAMDGSVPGGSMGALQRKFPEIASQLRYAMEFRPKSVEAAITKLRGELLGQTNENLANLPDAIRVAQAMREPTRAELKNVTEKDVTEALKLLRVEAKLEGRELTQEMIAVIVGQSGMPDSLIKAAGFRAGIATQEAINKNLRLLTKAVRGKKVLTKFELDMLTAEAGIDRKAIESAVKAWNVTEAQLQQMQKRVTAAFTRELKGEQLFTKNELRQLMLANGLDEQVFKTALHVVQKQPAMKSVTTHDINMALELIKADEKQSIKMLTRLYEQDAQISRKAYKDTVEMLREPGRRELESLSIQKATADVEYHALKDRATKLPPWDAKKVFERAGLPQEAAGRVHEAYAFAGTTFPMSTIKEIEMVLGDRGNKWVGIASKLQAVPRFLMTGMDWGYFMIQGLPILGTHPDVFAEAVVESTRVFFSPEHMDGYMSRASTRHVLEELLPHGLMAGAPATEFTEAMFGGYLGRGLEKVGVDVMGRRVTMATGPSAFARSFEAFGTVARIEMGRALLPRATSLEEKKVLADFLNKATGVISSRALGIGRTHRELEGAALLFSPRYTRGSFALLLDVVRGGLRGELARESLGAMMAAGMIYYNGLCFALGQEPNLDPSKGKFMTIEIAGHHVGIGSIWTAMARLLGNSLMTMTENPMDFFKWNPADETSRRDNPLFQFIMARIAPLMGTGYDILVRETYIGEPLDGLPAYGQWVVARNLMPFYLSAAVESGEWNVKAMGAEFMGLRTWPITPWEQYKDLRERYAGQEYKEKSWRMLTPKQKRDLEDKYPELAEAKAQVDADRLRRGGVPEHRVNDEKTARGDITDLRNDKLNVAQAEFGANLELKQRMEADDPTLTSDEIARAQSAGDIFGEKYDLAIHDSWVARDQLRKDFADVYEQYEEWAEENRELPSVQQFAYDQWIELMCDSASLNDEFGNPDYDEINRRKNEFRSTWGEHMYNQVSSKGFPDDLNIVREFLAARKYISETGYWDIKENLQNVYPQSVEEKQMIARRKTMEYLRRYSPSIAQIYERNPDVVNQPGREAGQIRTAIQTAYNQAMKDLVVVSTAVELKHNEMRRTDPRLDYFLQLFYDKDPLGGMVKTVG